MIRSILAAWAVAHSAAAEISLTQPIDCTLGRDCYIQQFVDHDPSKGARDFRCSSLSYNTHKGTDFALRSQVQMQAGVDVLAAAPGRVRAIRDGEPDRLYGARFGEVPRNRACGNGLIIDHAGGWSTQYCHLKQNSLTVTKGQTVERGAVLGQVGLSGRTQFPHLHLTLRRNNKVIDPFDPDGKITCGAPSTETLWAPPLAYQPGGMLAAGFADQVPAYTDIKAGTAHQRQMSRDAAAIVLFGYAFGGRQGDIIRLRIDGPKGLFLDEQVALEKNQAQFFRAQGKKRSASAWPAGRYRGTASLMRAGRVLSVEAISMQIR